VNQRELIVEVARTLPQPFTPQDLVVACWQAHPDAFGLAGYVDQYPSAARVYSKLHGSSGVIARGDIVQLHFGSLFVRGAFEPNPEPVPIDPDEIDPPARTLVHCGCVIGPVALGWLGLDRRRYHQFGPSALADRACRTCKGRGELRIRTRRAA
jgi:hypothetical protein